ncbi:MAG: hypothetical protein HQK53_09040 [Oligoflexia bacterium]|nr:hypothetical protein [Oligoflexia bacterium]
MESYKKCNGLQECDKLERNVFTIEECRAVARKNCENNRLDITHSKIITARFDGMPIISEEGDMDFCLNYAKRDVEFAQCEIDGQK